MGRGEFRLNMEKEVKLLPPSLVPGSMLLCLHSSRVCPRNRFAVLDEEVMAFGFWGVLESNGRALL